MMEVDKCADPVNGLKLAGSHSNRRITKSAMEKKRRARINTSLTELKTMLAGMIAEKTEKLDKLEKADILELTVKYVKQLQRTSVKGDTSMPDEKYRRGFNTCFNEVLKYISASDSCKPEMRAKVLSHLVDKFTNQNAAIHCTSQSTHLIENLDFQTSRDNQSQFLFNGPNRIPCSVEQSVEEPKYTLSVTSGEERHTALSVQIPTIVDGRKTNATVCDQNNNIQPIHANNHLNDLGNTRRQTVNTQDNSTENISLVQNSGLVKIASQNTMNTVMPNRSPVPLITTGTVPLQSKTTQLVSNQTKHADPATLQPNTMAMLNILKSNETRLACSPGQLPGHTSTYSSGSTGASQTSPIIMTQNQVQCLNYSAIPFANPADGQMTILVPANVITLPTLSPSGSAVFLACEGSNNASPVNSVQSPSQRFNDNKNETLTFNDLNSFVNVNNVKLPKNCVSHEVSGLAGSVKCDARPENIDSSLINVETSDNKDKIIKPMHSVQKNRYNPYPSNATRQTKILDGKYRTHSEKTNIINEYKNNSCDVSPTFTTSENRGYFSHRQKNDSPQLFEFQSDRIHSFGDSSDSQNTDSAQRSYFPVKDFQTLNPVNVWRPWNMQ